MHRAGEQRAGPLRAACDASRRRSSRTSRPGACGFGVPSERYGRARSASATHPDERGRCVIASSSTWSRLLLWANQPPDFSAGPVAPGDAAGCGGAGALTLRLLRLIGSERARRAGDLAHLRGRGPRPTTRPCARRPEVVDRGLKSDELRVLGLELGGLLEGADAAVGELDALGRGQGLRVELGPRDVADELVGGDLRGRVGRDRRRP